MFELALWVELYRQKCIMQIRRRFNESAITKRDLNSHVLSRNVIAINHRRKNLDVFLNAAVATFFRVFRCIYVVCGIMVYFESVLLGFDEFSRFFV